MENDPQGNMSPHAQAQCKNDPLAHHVNQARYETGQEGESALPKEKELGGRRFGRFDFRRGNQTG